MILRLASSVYSGVKASESSPLRVAVRVSSDNRTALLLSAMNDSGLEDTWNRPVRLRSCPWFDYLEQTTSVRPPWLYNQTTEAGSRRESTTQDEGFSPHPWPVTGRRPMRKRGAGGTAAGWEVRVSALLHIRVLTGAEWGPLQHWKWKASTASERGVRGVKGTGKWVNQRERERERGGGGEVTSYFMPASCL